MKRSLSERLPEHIFRRIHEDIGQASTCWSNLREAGTFESSKAGEIALNLCYFIADELDKVRKGEQQ